MVRDPVCGMQIKREDAAHSSDYQGQTYYFCSQRCKQRFDKNPSQFAGQQMGLR